MQVVASTTSWECSEPYVLEISISRWNHGSSNRLNECAAVQRQRRMCVQLLHASALRGSRINVQLNFVRHVCDEAVRSMCGVS